MCPPKADVFPNGIVRLDSVVASSKDIYRDEIHAREWLIPTAEEVVSDGICDVSIESLNYLFFLTKKVI